MKLSSVPNSHSRLRRLRDLLVAQPTALVERAFLVLLGLAICAVNLASLRSLSSLGTFHSIPSFVGATLVLLGVSEFVSGERTTLILALRLGFLALLAVSVGFAALLVLFMLNNAP